MSQLTLNFEPALPERFPTLRQFIAHRATQVMKAPKSQAADMDLAPSTLSRKLNPNDGDTQRFNVDDLESWLSSTGDAASVVEYIAAKFMDSDKARQARVLARVEGILPELVQLVQSMKASEAKDRSHG